VDVGWVGGLLFQDIVDFEPGCGQSVWAWREIVLDEAMQSAQVVAGDADIHVVLRVIVHMPVQETDYRIQRKCAGIEPKVGDIVLETDMLGVVTEEEEPAAVKRRQRDKNWEKPKLGAQRGDYDGRLANQDGL